MSSHRVPAHESWAWPLLELRTGTSWPALVLDLDHPDAYERLCGHAADGDIPWPNWSVERLSSRHIHVCYTLARPVLRGARARQRPLQLYGRITEYLGQTLQADRGYAHVLTHNPTMHRPGFRTYWGRNSSLYARTAAGPCAAGMAHASCGADAYGAGDAIACCSGPH